MLFSNAECQQFRFQPVTEKKHQENLTTEIAPSPDEGRTLGCSILNKRKYRSVYSLSIPTTFECTRELTGPDHRTRVGICSLPQFKPLVYMYKLLVINRHGIVDSHLEKDKGDKTRTR